MKLRLATRRRLPLVCLAAAILAVWNRAEPAAGQASDPAQVEPFTTNIDGLNIHFIHRRSKQAKAFPLIITHGWPGSFVEFTKIIGPLTDPIANGGRADEAFDVVIPSIPGFGFSDKPGAPGYDPARIAVMEAKLMARLGYQKYGAQGGDWGAIINTQLAL